MTKQEYIQVSQSLGLTPEMRGFSVVLASYTGPSYSDWASIYDHNHNTAMVNGCKRTFKTARAYKSALSKLLLKNKELILSKKLEKLQQDF